MDKRKAKATTLTLGNSLIKSKKKYQNASVSERHRQNDDENAKDYSVTENTSLEEFLNTAQMQNKQFIAEKQDIKIVTSEASEPQKYVYDESLEGELLIPRRPDWNAETTPEELHALENDNYLRWRRRLAQLQERDDVVLTPFEKNLEFWKQLWRVVERSDILVQILDARNPLLFHCEDLDKYIKEIDPNKMAVILLNKADFLNEQQRKEWLKYFNSHNKTAVFFSALQQAPKADDENDDDEESDGNMLKNKFNDMSIFNELHSLLHYRELVQYFKSLKSKLNITRDSITVGLVGYPNVGKSSTINALLRTKKVSVSAMPGKTKHFQTIILDDQLTICDCPGLVFPNVVSSKSEMIINGILPIDQMKDALSPVAEITSKIPGHVFESLYGIVLPQSDDDDEAQNPNRKVSALDLLSAYGYSRGFMTQRGLPDTSRAARYILKDFVTGRLLFCYAPPNTQQDEFHVYERQSASKPVTDKKLIKVFQDNCLRKKDFDAAYFAAVKTSAHTKGSIGIGKHSRQFIENGQATDTQNGAAGDKPWRKHNNRNKKEKLRRVYAHLDE